jgi:hypothetical protein
MGEEKRARGNDAERPLSVSVDLAVAGHLSTQTSHSGGAKESNCFRRLGEKNLQVLRITSVSFGLGFGYATLSGQSYDPISTSPSSSSSSLPSRSSHSPFSSSSNGEGVIPSASNCEMSSLVCSSNGSSACS